MDIKYSLEFVMSLALLSLVRCDIVVSIRSLESNKEFHFSLHTFAQFYECLCKSTSQCSVSASEQNTYYNPPRISREKHGEYPTDDFPCKHYQCSYRENPDSFSCTQVDPTSCQRSQGVSYHSNKCGDTKCVSIIWKYDNEQMYYSYFTHTVRECNRDCGCSTGIPPTATMETTTMTRTLTLAGRTEVALAAANSILRPTPKKMTTSASTSLTTKKMTTSASTSLTTVKTTGKAMSTTTRTTRKTTSLAQISSTFSEETTNPQEHSTAEINATVAARVSDSQKQSDSVPIVVGVVVALIVLATIAAVAVFLWKRRKGAAHKAISNCHEYANLPAATVSTKEIDTTTNVVNSNHDHPSQYVNYDTDHPNQYVNYDTDNYIFENDHANAEYLNQSHDDIVDNQHSDNHLYANCEPSRSLAVVPTDFSQPENASFKVNGGFVSFSNTLEESDDFTKSIYALANHSLNNDPEHTAGASSSNTDTDFHLNSSTNKYDTNLRTPISTAKSHAYERQIIEDDSRHSLENTHTNTELTSNVYSLDNGGYLHNDYEYAKQVDSTNSINDNGYSVSNSDLNSKTTYSMAATAVSNVVTNEAPSSHDYAKLGKDKHHFVNPYNDLQQTNEAPIPRQANTKQINHGKLPGQMDPYSVAEPIYEHSPQNDNIYSFQVVDSVAVDDQYANTYTKADDIVPGAIHPDLLNQLTNSSWSQQPNDSIYFELEKET